MMTLFDEERIIRNYVADERKETERKTVEKLLRKGKMSVEEIAYCCTELSIEEIRGINAEMIQVLEDE